MKQKPAESQQTRVAHQNTPDIGVFVASMTQQAYTWAETYFDGATAPFNYITRTDFDHIVGWLRKGLRHTGKPEEAAKRQLSLAEVKMMVKTDGNKKLPCGMPNCLNHRGDQVQPVAYALFSHDLIKEMKVGLSLKKAMERVWWRGSYFVDPETNLPLLLCGAPFAFDPRSDRACPAHRGCLALAIKARQQSHQKLRVKDQNLPFADAKSISDSIINRNRAVTDVMMKFGGRCPGNSVIPPSMDIRIGNGKKQNRRRGPRETSS